MENELRLMEESLLVSERRRRRFRNWGHLLIAVTVVVFLIYIFAIYKMLGHNLSKEMFTESLKVHANEMAPVITDASLDVMTKVSPVYMHHAKKTARELMPQITDQINKYGNLFINTSFDFAQKEFMACFDRIVNQKVNEFQIIYPDLTDEQMTYFISETKIDLRKSFVLLSQYVASHPIPGDLKTKLSREIQGSNPKMRERIELYALFLQKTLHTFYQ